jgi:hypothetical protein
MSGRTLTLLFVVVCSVAVGAALGYFADRVETANEVQRKHVPAECRWMEIEQPGQWEQTCDPEQKRKF